MHYNANSSAQPLIRQAHACSAAGTLVLVDICQSGAVDGGVMKPSTATWTLCAGAATTARGRTHRLRSNALAPCLGASTALPKRTERCMVSL
jgi:hypothetical protein